MNYSKKGALWKKRKGKEYSMDQAHHQPSSLDHNDTKLKKKKDVVLDREKSKRFTLVSFWDLPDYMKDNEFILHYYRANWPLKEAFFSIFRWHNETLNVWTYVKIKPVVSFRSSKTLKSIRFMIFSFSILYYDQLDFDFDFDFDGLCL